MAIHSCIQGSCAIVVGAAAAAAAAVAFRLPGLCLNLVLMLGSLVCSSAPVCWVLSSWNRMGQR